MNAPLHRFCHLATALLLLTAGEKLYAQRSHSSTMPGRFTDSSFSVFVNGGVGFTHANDAHINRWLQKYHYPTEPREPASLHISVDAMPVRSRLMYSVRLSTILSGKNLTSYNLMGGVYAAVVSKPDLLVLVGIGAGSHRDIITLNGDLPADYQVLAQQYNKQLSLHRSGLYLEPAIRAFWYPLSRRSWKLGFFATAGFDMYINSAWKLGYYDNNHGDYGRFRKLKKPADQNKVSEHGIMICTGLSFRMHLY